MSAKRMHRFGFSDGSRTRSPLERPAARGAATSPGPITVFAPNDDAFTAFIQKIGKTKMEIMEHPNLPNVIKSHIWRARTAENMPDGTQLTTIAGTTITISAAP